MVICCAAANCSNRQGKALRGAVSFHRFPLKDSKRLIQWLKAVQRDNWTPTKYSFLCSEHFTKDSFSKRLEDQHRLLKPTAVPTIFQLAEKKDDNLDYVRSRRKIASQVALQDGDPPREGGCEVVQRTSSSEQGLMVMQGTNEMEEATLQAEMGSIAKKEESIYRQLDGPRKRTLGDGLIANLVLSTPATSHTPKAFFFCFSFFSVTVICILKDATSLSLSLSLSLSPYSVSFELKILTCPCIVFTRFL
uniref:THAP-type domain-containing protein n=1 Tax=Nothoprocta perdicaria TaxID=30464 RepID=A0A8C6YL64_NOTPE